MKHVYLFPALAALLAVAPAARAQQAWQPFRAGIIYQYSETATPGDTTHTLQVGPGAAVAGSPDTVYRFNRRVPKMTTGRFGLGGGNGYQLLADNLFGATLRVRPGAVLVLTAANGRTFTLRPRAPLGQNWAAGPAGLTAHVMSRSEAQVLGRPDSVAWLMLSDGRDIRLSKHFGLLEGPSLDSYLNGRNRRRGLVLTGQQGTTTPLRVGPAAAYDWQPGDVFQRLRRNETIATGLCGETWTQDSVLTRALSLTGDSLIFTLRTRQLYKNYGQAGAPSPYCSATGTGYSATVHRLAVALRVSGYGPVLLTNTFTPYPGSVPGQRASGQAAGPAVRSSRYFRRPEWEQQLCVLSNGLTADSTFLQGTIDYGAITRYAVGLGHTRRYTSAMYESNDENLVAYRKGAETWGTFFSFRQLLAARATRPAATTTAFPQPFGTGLTVKFDLARPQPVALSLRDGLGRTVLTRPAAPLKAGPQQLDFEVQNLPGGVYFLHLAFEGEGRTEVLKVVKSN